MSAERWQELMSRKRFRGEAKNPREDDTADTADVRGPFVKDADRVIYSSAFRRLQDKTQADPFPATDYTRTRLTHSLEVTSVGRALGTSVGREVIKRCDRKSKLELDPSDFGAVVAAACLAHDIGNPPFGHAGEEAIRYWFSGDGVNLLVGLQDEQMEEFKRFEGNAQGFRILTRLQDSRDNGGLRLSCATLATFAKYPWKCASAAAASSKEKFGYFEDDLHSFEKVADTVKLVNGGEDGVWRRHPLAFLVEAADDICYRVVDIEDACKAKIISFEKAEKLLKSIAGPNLSRYNDLKESSDKIGYLRAKAIGVLVQQVYEVFWKNHDAILLGQFQDNLLNRIRYNDFLKDIRKCAEEEVYSDPKKLEAEAAGFEVIHGLLEIFSEPLLYRKGKTNRTIDTKKMPSKLRTIMNLLPGPKESPETQYRWLLRLTDYVSGMTDSFAVRLFRKLKGITVGLDLA